jgi:hypothetical protein
VGFAFGIDEDAGDEETGEHEKEINALLAEEHELVGNVADRAIVNAAECEVKGHHHEDGDATDAIERGHVAVQGDVCLGAVSRVGVSGGAFKFGTCGGELGGRCGHR